MALSGRHPHSRRGSRGGAAVTAGQDWTATRPSGMGLVGLLTVLTGAWGGVSAFVGPTFGYRPTTAHAWQWTNTNWLLHLVPGAVGVVAGLAILSRFPRHRAVSRGVFGLAGLLAVAAGAWFVIGPALWPVFQSSAAYAAASDDTANFVNQLGANLGPGILLTVFGGMALKSLTRDRPVTAPRGASGRPAADPPPPAERTDDVVERRPEPELVPEAAAPHYEPRPVERAPAAGAATPADHWRSGPADPTTEPPPAVERPLAGEGFPTAPAHDGLSADARPAGAQAPAGERPWIEGRPVGATTDYRSSEMADPTAGERPVAATESGPSVERPLAGERSTAGERPQGATESERTVQRPPADDPTTTPAAVGSVPPARLTSERPAAADGPPAPLTSERPRAADEEKETSVPPPGADIGDRSGSAASRPPYDRDNAPRRDPPWWRKWLERGR